MSRNRPYTDFPRNEQGLVDNFIGTAYDTVKRVYDNLPEIQRLDDVLEEIPTLAQTSVDNALSVAMPPIREELAQAVQLSKNWAEGMQPDPTDPSRLSSKGWAEQAEDSAEAAALSAIEAGKVNMMFPFLFDTNQLVYDVTVIAGRDDITTAGMVLWVEGAIEYDFTILSGTLFTLNQPSAYPENAQMRLIANARFDDLVKNFDELQDSFEQIFQDFLTNSGFEVPVPYAPGISITRGTQTVTYLGRDYRVNTPFLPLITSTWEADSPKMVLVGEGTLRADITDKVEPSKGVSILGRAGVMVDSIADLLLQPMRKDLRFLVDSYYAGTGVGGNIWRWDPDSIATPTYGSVLSVPGVAIGRFIVVKNSREFTSHEYGVRASNTGVDNRLRLVALYKACYGGASTVHLMDEDCIVDVSQPIIVPYDCTTHGGRGWIIPVFELPQPPQASQNNPDGTRKCYGGVFMSGDPITGLIWMGSMNNIYMGTIRFVGVKIKNSKNLTTAAGYALHGFFCNGGVTIYEDCIADDMPNNGYVTSFYREAHYLRCKGRRNGWGAAPGASGGAKNGISNTSTYTVPSFEYPLEDRSRLVTVQHCEFTDNKDEGIQYSSCPLVIIQFNDLRNNGDRAIEGDTAYVQTSKTRENDKVHVYGNDCRGKSGETRHSATFNDGFNKDVYLGGNIFGRCTGVVVTTSCTSFGSVTFTAKNTFELDDVGLTAGCHAMYLNAGLIDLQAGGTITGAHNRGTSELDASLLAANNDLVGGGTILMGDFHSDVMFSRVVSGRSKTSVRIRGITCPTGRAFSLITLVGDMSVVEISDCDGAINNRGFTSDGIVNFAGLETYVLDRLVLRGNLHTVHASTRYPVNGTSPAGRINRLMSSTNYWDDYSFNGGAKRLTAVVGLALKTSAQDMPVLV